MRARHADRIWVVGGLLAATMLLAVGWFLLIGPQHARAGALDAQTQAAQAGVAVQQQRLTELRRQQENLPQYVAQLAKARAALPSESGMPDFLRQLQVVGDETAVAVTTVTMARPVKVEGTKTPVFALAVDLTAKGTTSRLDAFLDQLQRVQPRAVLITSVSTQADDGAGSFTGQVTAQVALDVFVAPTVGDK
jgi:type IV pilus assembly protein PilO